MGKFTFHPVKSLQSDPKLRMLCLFGIEGFLLQYAVSLYTLANNLYATNLGATDTQIGLVQMVPNMVAGICMIPVGFLANRTKTSRTVPFVLALFLSAAYFAYGSVPLFGEHRMTAFFVFLGMTVGGIARITRSGRHSSVTRWSRTCATACSRSAAGVCSLWALWCRFCAAMS